MQVVSGCGWVPTNLIVVPVLVILRTGRTGLNTLLRTIGVLGPMFNSMAGVTQRLLCSAPFLYIACLAVGSPGLGSSVASWLKRWVPTTCLKSLERRGLELKNCAMVLVTPFVSGLTMLDAVSIQLGVM